MALFVIRHEHAAESCPGAHPQYGPMLLAHVSKENAATYGIEIQGEAVVSGAHTLYMIVDAQDPSAVDTFVAPFRQFGSAEVMAANTCDTVVAGGGCAAFAAR